MRAKKNSVKKKSTASKKAYTAKKAGGKKTVKRAHKTASKKVAKSAKKAAVKRKRAAATKSSGGAKYSWGSIHMALPKQKPGGVYVISESGVSKQKKHVAEKATAGQIRKSLGISNKRASNIHQLLKHLEKSGRLPKS